MEVYMMNRFVRSSVVILCAMFSMTDGSQVPKQQCVHALLTIEGFRQQHLGNVDGEVDSYDTFAIPYDKRDTLFVDLKSVRVQEYNGLSNTNWLEYVPCVSPLRKGLIKAVPLSDKRFPSCVPAHWLVDTNGAVKQDVSLEFAHGTTKVNFTVFVSTDIARELVDANNNVFTVMEWRREREAKEQSLRLQKEKEIEQEIYIKKILASIESRQRLLSSCSGFSVCHK
jgi:hypothetical protein